MPRVVELDVEDAGGELEDRAADQAEDREALDRVGGAAQRRPGEQPRRDRPQLGQEQRHRDNADGDVDSLVDGVEPRRRRRPAEAEGLRAARRDQRVAPERRLVGRVGEEARRGDDEHERQQQ
jgi:hypothetical protein